MDVPRAPYNPIATVPSVVTTVVPKRKIGFVFFLS